MQPLRRNIPCIAAASQSPFYHSVNQRQSENVIKVKAAEAGVDRPTGVTSVEIILSTRHQARLWVGA